MGSRGPAPLPSALKILHGESRPSRLNQHEPRPRASRPKLPAAMGEAAARVWRRVLREFGESGVISGLDADALRVYCEAVARYEYAAAMLERAGPLIRGGRAGEMVKNPLHQVVRDNADLIRAFGRELCLTPGARAGLTAARTESGDPMEDEFFGARRA